jgi:transposase
MIAAEYVTCRKQFKKCRLNWRKSGGILRSLGWVPFNTGAGQWKNGQVLHNGTFFKVWDSYGLSQYTFRSGSFNEDSRGRCYFSVVVEVDQSKGSGLIGIDLGCKETATDSNGDGIKGREYRALETKLGIAQRAKKNQKLK